MKKILIGLILLIAGLPYAYSQSCNCPPNEFGYPKAKKADTVFYLSNGKSIALCGYKDTINGRKFYSEFVLAACGEDHVIKFWGAVLHCQLKVKEDTLIVETLDSLPAGENMQYKWTVWAIERVYFKNGKAVNDFQVNKRIPKYNEQEIQAALKEYEEAIKVPAPPDNPNNVNNVNMEIADKLFMSAISGSRPARSYLKTFRRHFGGLSGEYLEWYDDIMKKLAFWDTGYNPDAIELNDSAVALIMNPPWLRAKVDTSTMAIIRLPAKDVKVKQNPKPSDTISNVVLPDSVLYGRAISLLDKALQIDSDYIVAYVSKFNFEAHLKRHKDALASAKEMVRLAPNDATIKFMAGKMYDEAGDTAQAKVYYLDYLTFCNHKLDTMAVKNRNYTFMQKEKAFALILLNQADKAHEIFKKLYEEAPDWEKDFYPVYMHLTRTNMLEDKELSVTVGDTTTSINTLFPEAGVSGPREIKY